MTTQTATPPHYTARHLTKFKDLIDKRALARFRVTPTWVRTAHRNGIGGQYFLFRLAILGTNNSVRYVAYANAKGRITWFPASPFERFEVMPADFTPPANESRGDCRPSA